MHVENTIVSFDDAPSVNEVAEIINGWQRARFPDWWQYPGAGQESIVKSADLVKGKLTEIQSRRRKSQLEIEVISWLYDFIRANVKRGRVFDLQEVLRQNTADCLGYAKLFTLLGRLFGLDVGVIEVVVDNAGRYVPHTACLVRLSDGRRRLFDLWYGSKNIRHKRVGLRVKRGRIWKIEDLEMKELSHQEVSYLPNSCVNAITLYIRGNRHLNRKEFNDAIKCYSEAIRLYPENARFYYNRAVAYESLGEHEKAKVDYARALRDNAAIIRVLAIEHEEIIDLIDLDTRGVSEQAQEIYLLHTGLITGRKSTPEQIARKLGLSEAEVEAILISVKAKLGH